MNKILISDFDDTFYINDSDILVNIDLVKRFRMLGNVFVIATGRSLIDFKNKLNNFKFEFDYLISNHGSVIFDKNFNVIFSEIIDDKLKVDFLKFLDHHDVADVTLFSIYEKKVKAGDALSKIRLVLKDYETAINLLSNINDKYGISLNAYLFIKDNSIEIISRKVDKAGAISRIINMENINNISVIGDSYNDISMIESYNGFCVSSALEDVKKLVVRSMIVSQN